ncbi:MAG: cation:H+ antiporter [Alteromonadaceae bacterium]|jgi:cation:H+ antiporter
MVISVLSILVGLTLLVWSADRFVFGAAAVAKNFGIPPLIIGLTIVAMGSSAPEMLVSATAALGGKTDTSVGNAIGSNITNILLVLGVTAMIRPLTVTSKMVRRELPLMLGICLVAFWMLYDNYLSRTEGIVLMIGFVLFILTLIYVSMKQKNGKDPVIAEVENEIPSGVDNRRAIFWVIVGLILLPLSAHILVGGAVDIALHFGISDLVIGLTIIAIGTSLPELAASVMGVLRNEHDLAIGNIVGSNIFNILAVLSLGGMIHPANIDANASARDFPIMLGACIALIVMAVGFGREGRINRFEGAILAASFIAYQFILFNNDAP